MSRTGTLFVVATPIGNLEDMSPRALRVLSEVSLILAEDTRHASKLTNHFQITTKLVACHDHNERNLGPEIVAKLNAGQDVALISDAGTPLISDPGYHVVHDVKLGGLEVVAIPGPCALVAALSVSGLPTDEFHFAGFLPPKGAKRQNSLESLMRLNATIVLYESPERLADLVGLIVQIDDRLIAISRELSKMYEQNVTGLASELKAQIGNQIPTKGECVVMIAKGEPRNVELEELLEVLIKEGLATKQAAKIASKLTKLKQQDCYNMALKLAGKSCSEGS